MERGWHRGKEGSVALVAGEGITLQGRKVPAWVPCIR